MTVSQIIKISIDFVQKETLTWLNHWPCTTMHAGYNYRTLHYYNYVTIIMPYYTKQCAQKGYCIGFNNLEKTPYNYCRHNIIDSRIKIQISG